MWVRAWRVGRVSVAPSPPLPYGGRIGGGEGDGACVGGGVFGCGVVWFRVVCFVFVLPLLSPPAPLWSEDWGGRGGRGSGAKVGGVSVGL